MYGGVLGEEGEERGAAGLVFLALRENYSLLP